MSQALLHVLDLIISLLSDLSHHGALLVVELSQFLLLRTLMLNLLIFKLVGDLLEALGGKLIRSGEVTLVLLLTTGFSVFIAAKHHVLEGAS